MRCEAWDRESKELMVRTQKVVKGFEEEESRLVLILDTARMNGASERCKEKQQDLKDQSDGLPTMGYSCL